MPRISCRCGQQISLHALPCPYGFDIMWEPERDQVVVRIHDAYGTAVSEEDFSRRCYAALFGLENPRPRAYECPHCGRLAVLKHAGDSTIAIWYRPEDDLPPLALQHLCEGGAGQDT